MKFCEFGKGAREVRGAVWYSDPVAAPVTEVQGNLSNLRSFSHGLHIPDCGATDT